MRFFIALFLLVIVFVVTGAAAFATSGDVKENGKNDASKWLAMSGKEKIQSIKASLARDFPNFQYSESEVEQILLCVEDNITAVNSELSIVSCSKKFRVKAIEAVCKPILDCVMRDTPKELQNNDEMLIIAGCAGIWADFIRGKYSREQAKKNFIRLGAVPDNASMCYGSACARVD